MISCYSTICLKEFFTEKQLWYYGLCWVGTMTSALWDSISSFQLQHHHLTKPPLTIPEAFPLTCLASAAHTLQSDIMFRVPFYTEEMNWGRKREEGKGVKPSYSGREAPRKVIEDLNNKASGVKGREVRVDSKWHAWDLWFLVYSGSVFSSCWTRTKQNNLGYLWGSGVELMITLLTYFLAL